jgi:hypothetical protein
MAVAVAEGGERRLAIRAFDTSVAMAVAVAEGGEQRPAIRV